MRGQSHRWIVPPTRQSGHGVEGPRQVRQDRAGIRPEGDPELGSHRPKAVLRIAGDPAQAEPCRVGGDNQKVGLTPCAPPVLGQGGRKRSDLGPAVDATRQPSRNG